MPVNNLREMQSIRNRWISATRRAIAYNNTRSTNSSKSSGTKLSTQTRNSKTTPTTPQSKRKK